MSHVVHRDGLRPSGCQHGRAVGGAAMSPSTDGRLSRRSPGRRASASAAVRLPRYRCLQPGCEQLIFYHNTSQWARGGATATRRCARFVLPRLATARV
jgi:hypothetical protein